ncbi:MAG: hypothetical protein ACRD3B_13015, partial [Candidatus Sulfotelmatobacter sp.]
LSPDSPLSVCVDDKYGRNSDDSEYVSVMIRLHNLTFALGVSFPAVRGRIVNAVNTDSRKKAWVKTLPLF